MPGTAIENSAAQPVGIKNVDVRTSNIDASKTVITAAKEPINRRISAPPDGYYVANTLRRQLHHTEANVCNIAEIHSNRQKMPK
ncbi:hypothetical protein [Mycolicibacterium sp. CBMA 234]|uniref:hypothetical protein n=1 Tax=Mycolicibacterium sp. CBMA 234 TaxID=1918495 RepID=UPI001391948C|nr:hypothetical protein [Mycolicibacterium sp. CBMA 234]